MNALPTGRALGPNRAEFRALVDDGFDLDRLSFPVQNLLKDHS